MKKVTEEDIKTVVTSLADSFMSELYGKKREELEQYYFFKWDPKRSIESNTYEFFDLLELYSSQCRRWEEHHNGSICVVERVRDTYTMPKIKEFIKQLKETL
jgi:hypothetical protein